MMQKYSTPAIVPGSGNGQNTAEAIFGSVDVYLASDVDARIASHVVATDQSNLEALHARVAELEKALRNIRAFLVDVNKGLEMGGIDSQIVADIDLALMESVTK